MKKNQTVFLKLCLADSLLKLMEDFDYDVINVNTICEKAGVGRSTFYRHFTNKNSKEDLLMFKIYYEWEKYSESHEEDVKKDGNAAFLNFIYESRHIFRLMHRHGLILVIMNLFETILGKDWPQDKNVSYLKAFFTYAYFGVIYQWIKYDFDETPEQLLLHIAETIQTGIENQAREQAQNDVSQN